MVHKDYNIQSLPIATVTHIYYTNNTSYLYIYMVIPAVEEEEEEGYWVLFSEKMFNRDNVNKGEKENAGTRSREEKIV